jgi:hypothetical protein
MKWSEINESKWSEMQWCEVKREVGKEEKNEILRGRVYMISKWWEVKDWGEGEAWVQYVWD